jgi:hypothetical protein
MIYHTVLLQYYFCRQQRPSTARRKIFWLHDPHIIPMIILADSHLLQTFKLAKCGGSKLISQPPGGGRKVRDIALSYKCATFEQV